ncbi:MAG: hypothetical protein GVY36_16350 [Verrucomicrobia bacterium]|nr:hypothetical protein [Verrucomicrobiota bacterium]
MDDLAARHRRRMRSTNPVESLNEEIRRRARVPKLIPNDVRCCPGSSRYQTSQHLAPKSRHPRGPVLEWVWRAIQRDAHQMKTSSSIETE